MIRQTIISAALIIRNPGMPNMQTHIKPCALRGIPIPDRRRAMILPAPDATFVQVCSVQTVAANAWAAT